MILDGISNGKKFSIAIQAILSVVYVLLLKRYYISWKNPMNDFASNNTGKMNGHLVKSYASLPKAKTIFSIENTKEHVIVLFNPVGWYNPKMINSYLSKNCPYSNCRITSNITNLRSQSAIIYLLTAAPTLPEKPPLSPTERNPDQPWIFAWLESPVHHTGGRTRYQSAPWRDTVNWTMTYTYDADIFFPYGRIVQKTVSADKDYRAIFLRKTKMVAWVVSHCHTSSKREFYVRELRKYNISVDIYGRCGGKLITPNDAKKVINNDYKFYLSFENSFCKDYITEKFFLYFQLDVVLVTRGSGNYSRLLSNDSFINAADFKTIKDLASHLSTVGANEERYINYLRKKDKFDASVQIEASTCELCEKINNLDSNRKVYKNLVTEVTNGTCFKPSDIV